MSAVNVIVTNDGGMAHILTDTAAYRRHTGKILGFVDKPRVFPQASAVLCGRGPLRSVERYGDALKFCTSFDEMADMLRRIFVPSIRARTARVLLGPIELTLVGWSGRQGKIVVLHGTSQGAYQMTEQPGVMAPGLPDDDTPRMPTDSEALRDRDAYPKFLFEIMKRQRALRGKLANAEIIGGAAILTQVTRGQIFQRVFHRWPDQCGGQDQDANLHLDLPCGRHRDA
jgi:hypothetical protein